MKNKRQITVMCVVFVCAIFIGIGVGFCIANAGNPVQKEAELKAEMEQQLKEEAENLLSKE